MNIAMRNNQEIQIIAKMTESLISSLVALIIFLLTALIPAIPWKQTNIDPNKLCPQIEYLNTDDYSISIDIRSNKQKIPIKNSSPL